MKEEKKKNDTKQKKKYGYPRSKSLKAKEEPKK